MKSYDGVRGGKYFLVQTEKQFEVFIEEANQQKYLSVDTETSGLDWVKEHVAGFVVGWGSKNNYYIPVAHISHEDGSRIQEQLTLEYVRGPLNGLLRRSDTTKYFWNAKFDLHFLRKSGIEVGGVIHDGYLCSFLLDENGDNRLKHKSMVYIDEEADKWEREVDLWRTLASRARRSQYTSTVNSRTAEMKMDLKLLAFATEAALEELRELGITEFEDTQTKRKRTTTINGILRMTAKEELEGTFVSFNKKEDISYDQIPLDIISPYACADTHYTQELVRKLLDAVVDDEHLKELYINEMKLCKVLFEMEHLGLNVDREYLANLGPELLEEALKAQQAVFDYVGYEFNIAATKQLTKALIDTGCKLDKITKGSQEKLDNNEITISQATLAVDSDVLDRLATNHMFAKKVLDFRRMMKLKSTYVDGILSKIDDRSYLHTSFRQNVKTGRMASYAPNIQNIDSKDKRIKKAFLAPDGGFSVFMDYSQIELRLLAHASQDPLLMSCYPFEGEGKDVHSLTTSQVIRGTTYEHFLKLREDKTGHDGSAVRCECPSCSANEDRKVGKTSNFLIIYGGGGGTLQKQVSTLDRPVSLSACYDIIDGYMSTYVGVRDLIKFTEKHVWKNGVIQNSFGRYRRFPGIWEMSNKQKYRAYRQAFNFLIQGNAADLFKYALVKVDRLIKGTGIKVVNVVHDDVQFYFPKETLYMIPEIVSVMEDFTFSVPIVADVEISNTNWAAKKELSRSIFEDISYDRVMEVIND